MKTILFVILIMLFSPLISHAGEYGKIIGVANSPEIRQWYRNLKMPDYPSMSCCGEADAYYADSYEETKTGEYIAIITDERPDCLETPIPGVPTNPPYQTCRHHYDIGTRIVVPKYKIKYDQGNPTGHGIIFLRPGYKPQEDQTIASEAVYCYCPPGGI